MTTPAGALCRQTAQHRCAVCRGGLIYVVGVAVFVAALAIVQKHNVSADFWTSSALQRHEVNATPGRRVGTMISGSDGVDCSPGLSYSAGAGVGGCVGSCDRSSFVTRPGCGSDECSGHYVRLIAAVSAPFIGSSEP